MEARLFQFIKYKAMTREQAKELLPIIQAWAEGKNIQFLSDGEWHDINQADFTCYPDKYRIKPEQKYRPFKTQEECWEEMLKHQPFGFLVSKDNGYFYLIVSVQSENDFKDVVITLATEPNTEYSCAYIFKHYIFSDGTPFGIKG